jgi:hypothetical protein
MNHSDNTNPSDSTNPGNPNAFLEHVRTILRLKHLSLRTEDSYLSTIRRFILFHGRRHPAPASSATISARKRCNEP